MPGDEYLQSILNREAVDTGIFSPVRSVQTVLDPLIRRWAGNRLIGISPSGSFAKGTANRSGTDIDLFISLTPETSETLKVIYDKLFDFLGANGYSPKRQNVSINIRVSGYDVDLVPGKRQDWLTDDHSLYRRRAGTWTKTNISEHIRYVTQAYRAREIRIVKLWRDQKRLDFPSFYLELVVISALSGSVGTLSGNVWKSFTYIRDRVAVARVTDPANTNNIISDDLNAADKIRVKSSAEQALGATTWNQIVT